MLPQSIELKRNEIESDHNYGIPKSQWMSLEQILKQALKEETTKAVAEIYELNYQDLLDWKNFVPVRKTRKKKLIITSTISPQLYYARKKRGMENPGSQPPMSKSERAKIAIAARWKKHD